METKSPTLVMYINIKFDYEDVETDEISTRYVDGHETYYGTKDILYAKAFQSREEAQEYINRNFGPSDNAEIIETPSE